ncbi:MAG: aminotransferase class III-fold pyridoxal phosphate-dependent enzyme [Melioribacteraceae bacterium]|nr:aminotransferase class III-fold pyridoxal phosphate-dependent enzyme [Melioribacteraceae bacterium]
MGVIPATEEFLTELREICTRENIVLIFDEVMTGFRVAPGGAQEVLGVKPDLTTFGKIIGGGLPVGAFGGKKEIMEKIAPVGPVYQAGTLSGNPLAMAAGYAALKKIKDNPYTYTILEDQSAYLEKGLKENLMKLGKDYTMTRVGSMMCMFFTEAAVNDFKSAVKSDTELYGKYFNEMLKNGVYLAPAQFEAMFVSTAHSKEDLDKTIEAHYNSLKSLL